MIKKLITNKLLIFPLILIALTSYSNQEDSNTIRIEMGDFYFKPDTIQLKQYQQVIIEFVNVGKLEHEFMVGRLIKTEKDQGHKKTNHTHDSKY